MPMVSRFVLLLLAAIIITAAAASSPAGIVEKIPEKWRDRYNVWRAELLSTGYGRTMWSELNEDDSFVLTIAVSDRYVRGAGTDELKWDENGKLVAATITLGYELDLGFPEPVYYPVLHSISAISMSRQTVRRGVLAGAKFAHELGHVEDARHIDPDKFELQRQLMPLYVSIFLSNGRDTADEKLRELAHRMGGTPVEIWADREYRSELHTLDHLSERLANDSQRCLVFGRLRRNLLEYSIDKWPVFRSRPSYAAFRC